MIKFLTVVGARPQFIKAAAFSRAITSHFGDKIKEIIVHTGQHYDQKMSEVFFEEMKIPRPDYNLQVGSGSHGKQTAEMMLGLENLILTEKPDCVILYGDTNSTLAGALAASKLHVHVAHIEAGLRSFNKSMPEEINRITTDHVSSFLFCPTQAAIENLSKEGFDSPSAHAGASIDRPQVFHCGDIMYDNSLYFGQLADRKLDWLKELGLEGQPFILSTVHRASNTDMPENLTGIFSALLHIAEQEALQIVLPLHPRTGKAMESLPQDLQNRLKDNPLLKLIPPVSFLEMTALEKYCEMIITDSGGVQKESYFFEKPCIVLREETEWIELVELGTAILAGPNEDRILSAFQQLRQTPQHKFPAIFGDGKAAVFMVEQIYKHLVGA